MKKVLAVLLSIVFVFTFAACGETASQTSTDANQTSTETSSSDQVFKVGVCQLLQHAALDAATQGFIDALNEALPGQVEIDNQNASGEPTNCTTIVNGFVADKVDLILANATPALQAACAATADIPILGTSITNYGTALELDSFDGTVGGNVSGTSDLSPLEDTANMVQEWFPDAKTVGMLYCSAEANSIYQVENIGAMLENLGYEVKEFSFTDTNDIASITQNAASNCDVIYIPTDNMCADNAEAIGNILIPAGVPAICGEENLCLGCGVATLTIDYYDLGVTTGKMAARILSEGEDISQMAIEFAPATKKFNAAVCEKLGLTAPEGYEAIE